MKAFDAPGIGKILLLDDISSAKPYKSFSEEIIIILETIEDYVNMALIQHRRIFMDLEHLIRDFTPRLGPHGIPGQPILAQNKAHKTVLFGDIHYYLICWGEISKLMERLDKLLSVNHGKLKSYYVLFDNYRKIRNIFEHFDERIVKGIHEIGVFDGTIFTSYNGYQVDLEKGENHLRGFYGTLLEIL